MIADTRSVTTCNVAIRQIFSYRTMSIRDRTIIKVTAQNNTLFFMLLNVFCYSLQPSGARFFVPRQVLQRAVWTFLLQYQPAIFR